MKKLLIAVAIVAAILQTGSHALAESQSAKTGVPAIPAAEGKPQLVCYIPVTERSSIEEVTNYLDEQAKMHRSLVRNLEAIRQNRRLLTRLATPEDRRTWQMKADHALEEARHLYDDYTMMANWLSDQQTVE